MGQNVSLFAQRKREATASKLEEIVLRGFGGGWNTVDEDTNMEPKYQPLLVNFRRTSSGAQKLRFGTKWFSDVSGVVDGVILDMEYFADRLVVVMDSGEIATVTNEGVPDVCWNSAIAALLPGTPAGWGAVTAVDFVTWKDQLIIHDGTDKPIIIDNVFHVTYLQDLATGSNVNVPIGKYGCIAANYHCVGGIPGSPTTIYISSRGTSGTFPGDAPPNDAISIDVGAYAPSGAPEIVGIAGYRQFLIVFFRGQSLIIQLGQYNDTGDHTPDFVDEMPQFGLLNHRCIATVENDLRFASYDGLASAKRNLFSGNIDSQFLSAYIEPDWRRDLASSNIGTPFVVYNALAHETYTFLNDEAGTVIVYQNNEQLKYQSWTLYEGFIFNCGCRSFLGRVFVANRDVGTTHIYQYGNDVFSNEGYLADFTLERYATWANATHYPVGFIAFDETDVKSFICLVEHDSAGVGLFSFDRETNPDNWAEYTGEDIDFTMELPWVDGRAPMRLKQCRYVSIDTRGTATFTLDVFVDYITSEAALSMDFVGNEALTGRKSGDPMLYGFPVKFKTMKARFSGSTKKPLTIAGLRFLFARGKYRR